MRWRIRIVDMFFIFFKDMEAPKNFDKAECEGIRFYSPIFFLGRDHLHPKAEEVELHRIPFPQNDPRRQDEAVC